jgi:hypothetical protein
VSGIVWLASYPKSGNTWLRVLLTNYERDAAGPADIDRLDHGAMAASRELLDGTLGLDSRALGHAAIEESRTRLYRTLAARSERPLYLKLHDAYTHRRDGEPLLPADATRAAIYVLRNPLDVAAAGAPFIARSLDVVISFMADEGFTMCAIREGAMEPEPALPQRLLSWSRHVESWVGCKDFPVHLVRFEDMSLRPLETFGGVVRFLGLPWDEERLRRAVAHSRFEELQRQEREHGFRERPEEMQSLFFRKGKVGSWREELTAAQVERVLADHGETMRRFGYLDDTETRAAVSPGTRS